MEMNQNPAKEFFLADPGIEWWESKRILGEKGFSKIEKYEASCLSKLQEDNINRK